MYSAEVFKMYNQWMDVESMNGWSLNEYNDEWMYAMMDDMNDMDIMMNGYMVNIVNIVTVVKKWWNWLVDEYRSGRWFKQLDGVMVWFWQWNLTNIHSM